jgi:hypothetical protein
MNRLFKQCGLSFFGHKPFQMRRRGTLLNCDLDVIRLRESKAWVTPDKRLKNPDFKLEAAALEKEHLQALYNYSSVPKIGPVKEKDWCVNFYELIGKSLVN